MPFFADRLVPAIRGRGSALGSLGGNPASRFAGSVQRVKSELARKSEVKIACKQASYADHSPARSACDLSHVRRHPG